MASETYYFFFSIIAFIAIVIHFTNMLYFKNSGKTIVGQKYEQGTPEYQKLSKFSNPSALVIATFVGLLFIVNLIYAINKLLDLSDKDNAHFVLVFAPISVILLSLALIFTTRNNLMKHKG